VRFNKEFREMFRFLFIKRKNNVPEFKAIFKANQRDYLNDPIGKFQKFELELRRKSLIRKKLINQNGVNALAR